MSTDSAPIHPQYYRQGAARLHAGLAPAAVERELIASGLAPAAAASVVEALVTQRAIAMRQRDAVRSQARGEMWLGGILCGVGVLITAATYSHAAHSRGGGTYLLAWGPIVFGAIRFFRGLSRWQ